MLFQREQKLTCFLAGEQIAPDPGSSLSASSGRTEAIDAWRRGTVPVEARLAVDLAVTIGSLDAPTVVSLRIVRG